MSKLPRLVLCLFAVCVSLGQAALPCKMKSHTLSSRKVFDIEKAIEKEHSSIIIASNNDNEVSSNSFNQQFKFKGIATLGFYFFLWYFTTVIYNITNKKVLNALPLPITMATSQFFFGLLLFVPFWFVSPPKITQQNIGALTKIASMHSLGNIATVVSLGSGAISFTHVVKASEPVFAAVFSAFLLGSSMPWQVYASLIPIIAGVSLASLKELSFTWLSLSSALASNVFNQMRIVLAKKELNNLTSAKMSGAVLFRVITFIAAFQALPIALFMEGSQILPAWKALQESGADLKEVMYNIAVSGFSYYISNEVLTDN
jgi:solute carrier family 35 protein E1